MNEENCHADSVIKISRVYIPVKPDFAQPGCHAPFRPGLAADAWMGRMNHRNEIPFSEEGGVFCDKPSDLPDFCNKWGGRHHDKAEVPGIVIGCPRLCNTPDRLCRLFIFTEGITIAKL